MAEEKYGSYFHLRLIIEERMHYMLQLNRWYKTIWHSSNRKRYELLGYEFTGYYTELWVRIEDLSPSSSIRVAVTCDYCGKEIMVRKASYMKQHDEEFGDACNDCKQKKQQDMGAITPLKLKEFKPKKEATCMKHYVVRGPLQCKEIREKVAHTTLQHGNCPTSTQQYAVYEMLKEEYEYCELNKQCSKNVLDCALIVDGIMIDVEYDGYHWHQDAQKDRRRDEVVKSYGYKILRIKGGHKVPTLEQLKMAIDFLVKSNHTFTTIELNENKKNK